jgi:regulator of protease activity HflC (stomatin/prohibitin superfamily)
MEQYIPLFISLGIITLFILISLGRSIRIVPAKTALVVERLGKYTKTLEAGFHLLVPFIDKVKYKHNLKEVAIDVPSQSCVTKDNVKVEVDGVLYLKVYDAKRASYGINFYKLATIQLAQTTMRSVFGRLELDKTFEERQQINAAIVKVLDEAAEGWGVKVTRYEIRNIQIPPQILRAMEVQMKAEREKRAVIARSEGEMQSKINYSLGIMEEAINKSEGEKEKRINEAEGKAREIESIANATAIGINKIAVAISDDGGEAAVTLRIAEDYITELRKLAKDKTDLILPLDLGNIKSVLDMIRDVTRAPKTQ